MEHLERKKFADLIISEIEKVENQIKSLKSITRPIAPDDSIGRLSRMEAINEKSVNEANLRKAEIRLQQLQSAQKRVQTEEYGFCVECAEEIPQKRLQLLPESLFCIQCQGKRT